VRISIIGAGPTGLFLAATFVLRGHRVTVVDRDPGPTADGAWRRRGVMQFHHAHLFRRQCAEVLQTQLPDAYEAWLAAGAEPAQVTRSDGTPAMFAVRSRRQTFETALRSTVLGMPAVTFHLGHVDAVTTDGGRATGVQVANSQIEQIWWSTRQGGPVGSPMDSVPHPAFGVELGPPTLIASTSSGRTSNPVPYSTRRPGKANSMAICPFFSCMSGESSQSS